MQIEDEVKAMREKLEAVKFDRDWLFNVLTEIRDALEKDGVLKAKAIYFRGVGKDRITLLESIDYTLDNCKNT